MASIEKRINSKGETSYRALVRIKGHPPVSKTFTKKTRAAEWASRTEIDIKEGKFAGLAAAHHTVNELIDKYLTEELPRKQNRCNDIYAHANIWRGLIGSYSLAAINTAILTSALAKIEQMATPRGGKKSPATMNRYIASLSVIFTYGYKTLEWISHNPIEKIRKYTEPRGRVRYLSDEERDRLLAACQESENPALYPAVMLAITSGARKEEILSLKWADVDLYLPNGAGHGILHNTKNNERRTIGIIEPVLSLLREMEKAKGNSEYVFPPQRTDSKTGHANINKAWYDALRKADITNFRFHDLRHTAASYLAMNGATMGEIADILGHKTLQMTKRYAHLSDAHKQSVLERVMTNTIFGGAK